MVKKKKKMEMKKDNSKKKKNLKARLKLARARVSSFTPQPSPGTFLAWLCCVCVMNNSISLLRLPVCVSLSVVRLTNRCVRVSDCERVKCGVVL